MLEKEEEKLKNTIIKKKEKDNSKNKVIAKKKGKRQLKNQSVLEKEKMNLSTLQHTIKMRGKYRIFMKNEFYIIFILLL